MLSLKSTPARSPQMMGIVSAAFLLLAIAIPSRVSAQDACSDVAVCATGVFCSGFEEGSKAIWDDWDGNPDSQNRLMTDPGVCNKPGNTVMRLRVPSGGGTADIVKVLPGSYDKLYARWYQKWEPGYDFTARNHGSGLHAGSRDFLGRSDFRPDGTNWFSSWIEPMAEAGSANIARPSMYTYYRGMYQNCSNPNGQCWGDYLPCLVDDGSAFCVKPQHRETILPPKFVAGTWYCIEVMLDGGTPTSSGTGANGVANYWINGVQYGPWSDLWLRSTASLKLTTLWLSIFHHGEHSVEGAFLDDVVVSTTRIGCHGSTSVPAPGAPANVRIIR